MNTGRPRNFDRQEALETAIQVFWKHGFQGTSKRDLMDATGLGSQSLYNAFGDKRSLFLEAVAHYADQQHSEINGFLTQPGSPLGNLEAFIRTWPEFSEHGCLMLNCGAELGSVDEELSEILHERMRDMRSMLMDVLERAKTQGEILGDTDCEARASALFSSAMGMALMVRLGSSRELREQVTAGALELVLSLRSD